MKMKKLFIFLFISFLFSQSDYSEYIINSDNPSFGENYGAFLGLVNNQLVTKINDIELGSISKFYNFSYSEWVEVQSLQDITNFQWQQLEDSYFTKSGIGPFNQNYPGIIYEYHFSDLFDTWMVENQIYNPDSENYHLFGNGFHQNGNLLVSCSKERNSVDRKFHLFEKVNTNWQQILEINFDYDNGVTTNSAFAINEDYFFIGMHQYDFGGGNDEGGVLVYKNTDEGWEYDTLISSIGGLPNGGFGSTVIENEGILYISAPYELNYTGAVYIYENINGEWTQTQRLTSSDIEPGDRFGSSFDVEGNTIIISAIYNQDAGPGSGSVYVFQKNDVELFIEKRKVCSSDLESLDLFGQFISVSGENFAVGVPMKNNLSGSIYIYQIDDTMLHSNFATYPVTGNAPLTLSFNDLSQGNPTSWQWDFDSDGIIDSEEQYPEHTYQFEGDFTVTLTVSNEEETSTFTKENYISVTGGLLYGDIDQNGEVNILDIIYAVDFVLGNTTPTPEQAEAGDMNNSGTIDIIDLVLIVNVILEN